MGSLWKRCTHDGRTTNTGLPARGSRAGIPACRCTSGSWWWRTDLPPAPDGGRRQLSGHEPTKVLAAEALREAEARIDAGTLADDHGLTVGAWLTRWLAEGTWKPKARASYASDVRVYLVPHLGDVRLKDLRRRHVREMLAAMASDGRSGHVCDKARRTLRSALTSAIGDELLVTNPAEGRMTEIPRRQRTSGTVLEVEQTRQFVDHNTADPLHSLYVVAAFTGLRRGELLGMPWTAVSLTGNTPADLPGVDIDQTVVELPGPQPCPVCAEGHTGRLIQRSTGRHAGAKSEASRRWAALNADCVAALLLHRAVQEAHRERAGDLYVDHGLVWADADGAPLRPDGVTKRFAAVATAAALPDLTPKVLRRGAASMLIDTGMPIELVALTLGHGDRGAVAREHYVRAMRSRLAESAEDVARLVRGQDPRRTG